MPGMENILPREYQFDASLKEVGDDLLIGDLCKTVKRKRDIIDFSKEQYREANLRSISPGLTRMIIAGGEDPDEVQRVVYRSLAFTLQTIDDIKVGPIDSIPTDYLEEVARTKNVATDITADVQEYLFSRPNISAFIYTFLSHIDASYLYHHHVTTVSGLLFMLAEQSVAEQYLQAELENFDISVLQQEGDQ